MQRVTNCILEKGNEVLTLRKPKRGWWVAPGGKMEVGESIRETAKREFYEETGITIKNPELRGVFTIVVEENEDVVNEWMMFTFHAKEYDGELLEKSPEGHLAWQEKTSISNLPMASGDYFIWDHVLNRKEIMYGTFYYTKDFDLLSYRLEGDDFELSAKKEESNI
ncbi:8-oxo-dGTP diphosphatase [Evansella sp. AB-rgal1]|uniref:8-oxo-dGTP diphosphatase n=1 Tax=Evansella sp. AB-rgal1 TaxID=3242696 RepID=UPI00359DE515